MAQLLYCIHCYFPVDTYLTEPVAETVRRWMTIPYKGGVIDALAGFTKDGRPRRSKNTPEYHTGIYEFLRRADIDPSTCSPLNIFRECMRLNADMGG